MTKMSSIGRSESDEEVPTVLPSRTNFLSEYANTWHPLLCTQISDICAM